MNIADRARELGLQPGDEVDVRFGNTATWTRVKFSAAGNNVILTMRDDVGCDMAIGPGGDIRRAEG